MLPNCLYEGPTQFGSLMYYMHLKNTFEVSYGNTSLDHLAA